MCGKEAWTEEDLEHFVTSRAAKYGKANKCRDCAKDERLIHRYGITQEQYDEHMATSICCEICGITKELVYDHNHNTEKFRGVLCRTCNQGIGLLKDNPKITNLATQYLLKRGHYGD